MANHENKDLSLQVEVPDVLLHKHVEAFYEHVRKQEPQWRRLGLPEIVGYYARAAVRAGIFLNVKLEDVDGMSFGKIQWLGELADDVVSEAMSVDVKN